MWFEGPDVLCDCLDADWLTLPFGNSYSFVLNVHSLVYCYFLLRKVFYNIDFILSDRYSDKSGFHIIGAHTDSPCLKLKPVSAATKSGFLMVNVQTYGGGLWYTWFDRDLSVAGRVILKTGDGAFVHKLVKVKRPLLRVPTLAIHLDRLLPTLLAHSFDAL